MNEQTEICGHVWLRERGYIELMANLEDEDVTVILKPSATMYTMICPSTDVEIELHDVVEAKVEIACYLREHYSFKESTIECVKELVEDRWVPPMLAMLFMIAQLEMNKHGT